MPARRIGKRSSAIVGELGLAKSTVTFHLHNLGASNAAPHAGRRGPRQAAREIGVARN